ncbi:RHS domain-containing protein [Burkholderia ambifaria]|uniref:RHS domain-containing protein n=1 Tax=Burkholderia ambifaria TaxID=152480 RepID=UPI001E32888B|nr:RHS domain-containing protein [Burkholderia ambifaria]UEP24372.1 RHS domain-containing protein [Burkholderia ambifaria]
MRLVWAAGSQAEWARACQSVGTRVRRLESPEVGRDEGPPWRRACADRPRASAANDANARDAVYYFHNDLSGLPEELTDADGELVWQARYKVWGNAVQEEWIAREPQRSMPAWRSTPEATSTSVQVPRPQTCAFRDSM